MLSRLALVAFLIALISIMSLPSTTAASHDDSVSVQIHPATRTFEVIHPSPNEVFVCKGVCKIPVEILFKERDTILVSSLSYRNEVLPMIYPPRRPIIIGADMDNDGKIDRFSSIIEISGNEGEIKKFTLYITYIAGYYPAEMTTHGRYVKHSFNTFPRKIIPIIPIKPPVIRVIPMSLAFSSCTTDRVIVVQVRLLAQVTLPKLLRPVFRIL